MDMQICVSVSLYVILCISLLFSYSQYISNNALYFLYYFLYYYKTETIYCTKKILVWDLTYNYIIIIKREIYVIDTITIILILRDMQIDMLNHGGDEVNLLLIDPYEPTDTVR